MEIELSICATQNWGESPQPRDQLNPAAQFIAADCMSKSCETQVFKEFI